MSDLLELIFSEPKLLLIIVLSVALGWVVGSYFGLTAGLVAFAVSFVGLGVFTMVRAWSRSR